MCNTRPPTYRIFTYKQINIKQNYSICFRLCSAQNTLFFNAAAAAAAAHTMKINNNKNVHYIEETEEKKKVSTDWRL